VTQAILRVPIPFLQAGDHTLSTESSKYVLRVHRLTKGDRFIVFDPEQVKEAEAEIVDGGRLAQIHISALRPASLLPERSVTVLQALAKGAKIDAIVRGATELGATRIVVAVAERSVKREVSETQHNRWRRIAVQAARQCGRGDLPEIDVARLMLEAIAAPRDPSALALCLHPEGERSVMDALAGLSTDAPVVILIGPEGGLSEAECDAARDHGFEVVQLARFVLRTETACAAVLGAVAARSL
jgi:16S rRNA (uracil1498-N3)-methyltransferase